MDTNDKFRLHVLWRFIFFIEYSSALLNELAVDTTGPFLSHTVVLLLLNPVRHYNAEAAL